MQKSRKSYMDSRARKNLTNINAELHDVQRIMVQNINDVLQRGEHLSGTTRWGGISLVTKWKAIVSSDLNLFWVFMCSEVYTIWYGIQIEHEPARGPFRLNIWCSITLGTVLVRDPIWARLVYVSGSHASVMYNIIGVFVADPGLVWRFWTQQGNCEVVMMCLAHRF